MYLITYILISLCYVLSFYSLKIAPVSHLKSCTIEGGSLSANAFMCVSAIGCIRTQLDFFGIHQTTFEGIVLGARIYAYPIGCEKCSPKPSVSESIEAIGKAIQDGVKVVSVSIDFSVKNREYQLEDPKDDDFGLKILDAMKEDILTCLAVGDDGPIDESAMNGMPWALTVGAHTGNILETDIEIAIRRDVPSIKISYDENEKWRIIGKFKVTPQQINT